MIKSEPAAQFTINKKLVSRLLIYTILIFSPFLSKFLLLKTKNLWQWFVYLTFLLLLENYNALLTEPRNSFSRMIENNYNHLLFRMQIFLRINEFIRFNQRFTTRRAAVNLFTRALKRSLPQLFLKSIVYYLLVLFMSCTYHPAISY